MSSVLNYVSSFLKRRDSFDERGSLYLSGYRILEIPGLPFNVYLQRIHQPQRRWYSNSRVLAFSILLSGGYTEQRRSGDRRLYAPLFSETWWRELYTVKDALNVPVRWFNVIRPNSFNRISGISDNHETWTLLVTGQETLRKDC